MRYVARKQHKDKDIAYELHENIIMARDACNIARKSHHLDAAKQILQTLKLLSNEEIFLKIVTDFICSNSDFCLKRENFGDVLWVQGRIKLYTFLNEITQRQK